MKNRTAFQESFDNGILSKIHFQNSQITKDFIAWLIPFINEEGENLELFKLDYKNFNEAINKYRWPLKGEGLDYRKTIDEFSKWRKALGSADHAQLLKTCKEILKWGGIKKAGKLETINNLRFFLDHLKMKLSQEEIIIYDLNPNFINSGFTKIYAALNDKFVMYDGRVGAALCYIIRSYLDSNNKNVVSENKTQLPSELKFGWAWGMGDIKTRKNRNPNNDKSSFEEFEEITERTRELHFLSNIKANWLLEIIAKNEKVLIPQANCHSEKVFALQTGLFVLGSKLPSIN